MSESLVIRPQSPNLPLDNPAFVELMTDAIVLDPEYLDAAIIGHDTNEDGEIIFVYSYEKLTEAFRNAEEGWNDLDAMEWVDFNTVRALPYMGDRAPIIKYELEDEENKDEREELEVPRNHRGGTP